MARNDDNGKGPLSDRAARARARVRVWWRGADEIDVEGTPAELIAAGFADQAIVAPIGKSGERVSRDANGDPFRVWRKRGGRIRVKRTFSADPVYVHDSRGYKNRLPAADAEVAEILSRLTRNPRPADFDPAVGAEDD